MGRYRAATPPSSPYITEAGYRALQAELQRAWQHRAEVTRALAAAAAEGDRSENAEYQYRKKELRELDRRIRYLQKRLPDLKVVSGTPPETDKAFFGAWVQVEDGAGEVSRLRIVGADEYDALRNWISVDSPVARALLGRRAGDTVRVRTPTGWLDYTVQRVEYG